MYDPVALAADLSWQCPLLIEFKVRAEGSAGRGLPPQQQLGRPTSMSCSQHACQRLLLLHVMHPHYPSHTPPSIHPAH